MAIASTKTLLPLDTFARIVGLHPLHFNGIAVSGMPICSKTLAQHTWQTADAISREEIAIAISEAEQDLASYLGFTVAPTWIADERINFSRSNRPELMYSNQSFKVNNGHVISGGIEQKVLLVSGSSIIYTDVDGDGYAETATVTLPVSTNLQTHQVAVYYPNHDADDAWEIRPVLCTGIDTGTATITMRREQLLKENLLTVLNPSIAEGLTDSNFLTEVDIYRHYNDPQLQGQFMWRSSACCTDGCGSCVYDIQPACLQVRDHRLGMFNASPATWNIATQSFDAADMLCTIPERIRTWYYAGYQRNALNNVMDPMWQHAVAKLALTKLDRPICSCHAVTQTMERWTIDLRHSVGTSARSSAYRMTNWELENCPFGATPAGLDVWRLAKRYALSTGG